MRRNTYYVVFVLSLLLSPHVVSAQSTGLVSSFNFDEGSGTTLIDRSGNANTGTLVNGPAWTTGKNGGALLFDGVNDSVVIPNSGSVDISGTGLTLSAWVKVTDRATPDMVILQKSWSSGVYAGALYQYAIEFDTNGGKTADMFIGPTTGSIEGPHRSAFPTGVWAHLAYTFDGSSIKGYVNGVLAYSSPLSASIAARGTPLVLGVDPEGGQAFSGLLDDLRIYGRALSQAEIQADMNTPVGGTSGGGTPPPPPPGADTTPPSVPTGLTANVISQTQIDLSWSASTDNVGVQEYRINRNGVFLGAVTGTSYSDPTLSAGNTYVYTIEAKDAAGNISAPSGQVSATTLSSTPPPPPPPSGSSVLATVSASMQPGTWAKLGNYPNLPTLTLDSDQWRTFEYSYRMYWVRTGSAGTGKMVHIGSGHSSGVWHLVEYNEASNTWTKNANASLDCHIHSYDQFAVNTSNGLLYSLCLDGGFRKWNGSSWQSLAAWPGGYPTLMGMAYFPETGKVWAANGWASNDELRSYDIASNSWSYVAGVPGLGENLDMLYSPIQKKIVISGGDGNKKIYVVGTNGSLTTSNRTTPYDWRVKTTLADYDPTTGDILIFSSQDNTIRRYDPTADQLTVVGTFASNPPFSMSGSDSWGHGVILGTVPEYGVIMIAEDTSGDVWLYKPQSAGGSFPPAPDTTPPTTPTGLTGSAVSTSQVNLSWTASTDAVGVTGYRVERCQGSGCTTFSQVGTPTTNAYSDSSLSSGTTYVYRVRATDAAGNLSAYSSTASVTTQTVVTPPPQTSAFYDVPSQLDEQNTYTNVFNWTWTSADKGFDFVADPGAFSSGIDVHNDMEGDDLWTWYQQYLRTGSPLARTWAQRWRDYFVNVYPTDVVNDDYLFDYDHIFGNGLVLWAIKENDAAALAAAERIGDIAIGELGGTLPLTDNNVGYGGGREYARWSILFTYLAQATGKQKWIDWRDALIGVYMNASNWQEAPTAGIAQGGYYFVSRNTLSDYPNWNGIGTVADYDAGRRVISTFMGGLQAEALWRAYLATGRTDIKDRLIKMARYAQYYGHDPSWTNPFVTAYFGSQNGARWHRDTQTSANSSYDASVVNVLVWGYKLTGDPALLDRAKVHLRQGTRWAEGEPGGGQGPIVAANEVSAFVDTRRNPDQIYFTHNKGQLQYSYQLFENGGAPTVLSTSPSNKFISGDRVQVSSGPLNVRATANTSGTLLGTQATGALGTVIGGPTAQGGFNWWNINYDTGVDGWSVENYLVKYTPPSDTTPPTLSGISAGSLTSSGVTISWTTNEAADTQVEYGLTASYGQSTVLNTSMLTSHSQSLSGLQAGTLYHYRVKSKDAAGNLAVSSDLTFTTSVAPDTTPPSAPTNLSGTALSTSQINLSWTASTDVVGVTGYRVERCQGSGCTSFAEIATTVSIAYTDTNLSSATTYRYRVRATDLAGNLSAYSSIFSVTTLSATTPDTTAPVLTNILVTGSATSLTFTWTTNEPATSKVAWGTSNTALTNISNDTTLQTSHSVTVNDLQRRTTYYYQISSTDAAGNTSNSGIGSLKTGKGNTAPITNLQAANGSVVLRWSPSADPHASSVVITRSTNGSVPAVSDTASIMSTLPANATTYRDSAVSNGTTYTYAVYALDDEGTASLPSVVSFTPTAPSTNTPSPVSGGGGGGGSTGSVVSVSSTPSAPSVSTVTPTPTSDPAVTAISLPSVQVTAFEKNLSRGSEGADVKRLQEFLVQEGHLTQGSATGYFGPMTEAALKKYQCVKGIVCSGTSETTGYGVTGPKTRGSINQALGATAQTSSSLVSETERAALIKTLLEQILILTQQLNALKAQQGIR